MRSILKPVFVTLLILLTIDYFYGMYLKFVFDKLKTSVHPDILRNAEKIYRLETDNFRSYLFLSTHGAGMEATKIKFPYGWTSLKNFWLKNPDYKPIGLEVRKENVQKDVKGSGGYKTFIKFASFEAGLFTLCQILANNGNDVGKYFSKDPLEQEKYIRKISKIKSVYV